MNPLETVFDFTPEDLAANEAGYTSFRQRHRLAWRYIKKILGGFLLFSAAFILLPALIGAGEVGFITGLRRMAIGCILPTGIFTAALLSYKFYHLYRSKSKLCVLHGAVILSSFSSENKLKHNLQMGGKIISEISEEQFEALKSGEIYEIYLLPSCNHILSIKPVSRIPDNPFEAPIAVHPAADDHHSRLLRQVFYFTPKDLAENEAGFLTRAQHRKIMVAACETFLGWIVIWSVLGIFVGLLGLVANSGNGRPLLYQFEYILLFLLPVLPGIMGLINRWTEARQDIKRGTVEQVCGAIRHGALQPMNISNYFSITIEGQQFHVSGEVLYIVENNVCYCAYYVPATRVIVSIKKVETESGVSNPAQ